MYYYYTPSTLDYPNTAVPFTYSAEIFRLEIRGPGMAFGTSITWIFSWALGKAENYTKCSSG